MDWTKAKNILIIALVLTNMVLAGAILQGHLAESKARAVFLADTLEILSARGISIEAPIPEDSVKMPVLTVEHEELDTAVLEELLSKEAALPLATRSQEALIDLSNAFLEKCGIMNENVALDFVENKNGVTTIHYANVHEGIRIEESFIRCSITDGRVTGLERVWLKPVERGKTGKEVVPVAEALIRLMSDAGEASPIRVEKIELIYWLDMSALEMEGSAVLDTAFPAWKIVYNGDRIMRVDAFGQ